MRDVRVVDGVRGMSTYLCFKCKGLVRHLDGNTGAKVAGSRIRTTEVGRWE